MKKVTLILSLAFIAMCSTLSAQSHKVGKHNDDGVSNLSISEQQAIDIIREVSLPSEAMPFEATDILFTSMDDGTICLTGYFRNPAGHIVKGFRIQCNQDDENNLIVMPGNKKERVIGRPF